MEESIRELWMSGDVSTRICRTDWGFRGSLSHPLLPVIIDGNPPIQRKERPVSQLRASNVSGQGIGAVGLSIRYQIVKIFAPRGT